MDDFNLDHLTLDKVLQDWPMETGFEYLEEIPVPERRPKRTEEKVKNAKKKEAVARRTRRAKNNG